MNKIGELLIRQHNEALSWSQREKENFVDRKREDISGNQRGGGGGMEDNSRID